MVLECSNFALRWVLSSLILRLFQIFLYAQNVFKSVLCSFLRMR